MQAFSAFAGSKAVDAGKTETVSTSTSGGAFAGRLLRRQFFRVVCPGGSSSGGSTFGRQSGDAGRNRGRQGRHHRHRRISRAQLQGRFTLGGTTVTVDGADVKNAVSKVTDDGAVAKIPLVAQPGSVTLTSGAKTQTISRHGRRGRGLHRRGLPAGLFH
ncbi:MAG: hypothetical protein ACLR4Z_13840 [Butyricicoccaceae bacterium]